MLQSLVDLVQLAMATTLHGNLEIMGILDSVWICDDVYAGLCRGSKVSFIHTFIVCVCVQARGEIQVSGSKVI